MYCGKCGKENADGAAFCSGCGNPLPAGGNALPTGGSPPAQAGSGSRVSLTGVVDMVQDAWQNHRMAFIAVCAGIVAALIVWAAAASAASAKVYVDWAKSAMPLDGEPITMDAMFSRYLASPNWSASKQGDKAVVEISGKVRDTDASFQCAMELELNEDGSDWLTAEFTKLSVGGRSLSDTPERNESIDNIALAYEAGWNNLGPYVQAFSTNYGSWTVDTWDMAVYSQKAKAAEYVINEIGDSIVPGLSQLFRLADSGTMNQVVEQTIDSIGSTFDSAARGATLNDILDALRVTLGFLAFLFSMAG